MSLSEKIECLEVKTDRAAYVDASAAVYGRVVLGEGVSLWPNVVIRSEINAVSIGDFTNIQDFAMVHIGYGHDVRVGRYCSITHRVTLHGCTIEDYCLIGIGATVMDGCTIGRGSIVAGHAFVREGTIIPPFSIVMGAPAKVVREQDCSVANVKNALLYHRNAQAYRAGDHRIWASVDDDEVQREALAIVGLAAH